MGLVDWGALILFALLVMSAALYGLTVSGQFPGEHRAETLRSPAGAAVLWSTMAAGLVTAIAGLALAWMALPWTAAVIVGGGVLLVTPLILRLFPDSFVDGRAGLVVFAGMGAVLSISAMVLR
ncbi:MAG: hypothetical protein ACK4TL_13620 [Hyphomicrobiaceae bacterium]